MMPKHLALLCLLPCASAAVSDCVSGNCMYQGDETSLMQIDGHLQHRVQSSNSPFDPASKTFSLRERPVQSAPSAPSDLASSSELKESYLGLLASSLTGSLQDEAGRCDDQSPGGCSQTKPYDPAKREIGRDWPPWGQTMVGFKRLNNIRMTLEDVVANKVPGDYAELGVWRGGTGIWSRSILNLLGEKGRKVHMFDAWEQIPTYNEMFKNGAAPYLAFTEDGVRHNFDKYKVLDDSTCKFHKGLFKDTVPTFAQDNPNVQLSVLRIDGNFYDSHQDALYNLYSKVPVGGFVIFDDYFNDPVARQAWEDFQADQGFTESITQIDPLSGYFKKTKDVTVDMSKMKPPRDCNK